MASGRLRPGPLGLKPNKKGKELLEMVLVPEEDQDCERFSSLLDMILFFTECLETPGQRNK